MKKVNLGRENDDNAEDMKKMEYKNKTKEEEVWKSKEYGGDKEDGETWRLKCKRGRIYTSHFPKKINEEWRFRLFLCTQWRTSW